VKKASVPEQWNHAFTGLARPFVRNGGLNQMKHFNEKEWQMFRRGEYSQEESRFMEEHLRGCQQCLNAFLNSIDEEDLLQAQERFFGYRRSARLNGLYKHPFPPVSSEDRNSPPVPEQHKSHQ
jgi:hypothetical protein